MNTCVMSQTWAFLPLSCRTHEIGQNPDAETYFLPGRAVLTPICRSV
jgi:hypothetical protein